MILADFHTHTSFSDGRDTPEEMILAAIERGLEAIGISDHSHTPFDDDYCLGKGEAPAYLAAVRALSERYRGKIRVYAGIEQDFYTEEAPRGFDYVIGSVHYVKVGEGEGASYLSVDRSREEFSQAVLRHFAGDFYAFCEAYYQTLARVVEKTGADLIGHFDLVTKFNRGGALFDEAHPRYVKAWQSAADALLRTGKAFEVNTGAVSRGYRPHPYPSGEILAYLKARGARLVLSSDAHTKGAIAFSFEESAALLS